MRSKGEFLLNLAMLAVVCPALALPVMAEDIQSKDVQEPTSQDLKNSKDRGLYIDPLKAKKVKSNVSAKSKTKKEEKSKDVTAAGSAAKPAVKLKKAGAGSQTKPAVKNAKAPVKKQPQKKIVKKTAPKKQSVTAKSKKVTPQVTKTATIKKDDVTPVSFSSRSNIVAASLNKAGSVPLYKDGEKLRVTVKAYEDCNLMIFNFNGQELTQIFPNEYQQNPLLKAGDRVDVGGAESKFEFIASHDGEKPSKEKIFVYAYPISEKKKPITVAMNKLPSSPFRSTKMTIEQYRELVNNSKSFFSRSVKVVPKKDTQLADYENSSIPPNKLELNLVIRK